MSRRIRRFTTASLILGLVFAPTIPAWSVPHSDSFVLEVLKPGVSRDEIRRVLGDPHWSRQDPDGCDVEAYEAVERGLASAIVGLDTSGTALWLEIRFVNPLPVEATAVLFPSGDPSPVPGPRTDGTDGVLVIPEGGIHILTREGRIDAVWLVGPNVDLANARERVRTAAAERSTPPVTDTAAMPESPGNLTSKTPVGVHLFEGLSAEDSAWIAADEAIVAIAGSSRRDLVVSLEDRSMIDAVILLSRGVDPSRSISVDEDARLLAPVRLDDGELPPPSQAGREPPTGRAEDCDFDSEESVTIRSDLVCEELTLDDQTVLVISGEVTIEVEDEFEIEDEALMKIDPGSKLTLVTHGSVHLSTDAGGGLNPHGAAGDVTLFHVSEDTVVIGGKTRIRARVLAPNSRVVLKGRARFQGFLSARFLEMEGDAGLEISGDTADTSLLAPGAPPTGGPTPVR